MDELALEQNQKPVPVNNDSKIDTNEGDGQSADNRIKIVLSPPTENQNQIVPVSPGLELHADFNFSNVTIGKAGGHLILQFEEGGTITLENIAVLIESDQAPAIFFKNGSILSTEQLLSIVATPESIIEPAAGEPDLTSGGVGDYQDNPGAILEGVEKLDGVAFETAALTNPIPIDQNGNAITTTDTETFAVGELPVAVDDTITTVEDTAVSSSATLQSNDTTADGGTLNIASASVGTFTTSQGGTIVVAPNGSYTYTPAANFTGEDTFDYTVTDGNLTDTGTLTITVTPVNDAPDVSPDGYHIVEGEILTVGSPGGILTNDTDVESDTFTAIRFAADSSGSNAQVVNGTNSVTTALGGTVVLNADGSFQYNAPTGLDHSASDVLSDSFYYQASDGQDASAWTRVEVSVGDSVPSSGDIEHTLEQGRAVSGDLAADSGSGSDGIIFGADGGHIQSITIGGVTHTYDPNNPEISISTPQGGTLTLDCETGEYTYQLTPNGALYEDEVFSIVGVDGDGDIDDMTLTVHPPLVANPDTVLTNVTPGTAIEIPDDILLHNDSGTDLTINQVANPVNGTVDHVPEQVSFTIRNLFNQNFSAKKMIFDIFSESKRTCALEVIECEKNVGIEGRIYCLEQFREPFQ